MIDVYGVPLGGSGGGLCGLKQRRRVGAYPLGDDGLARGVRRRRPLDKYKCKLKTQRGNALHALKGKHFHTPIKTWLKPSKGYTGLSTQRCSPPATDTPPPLTTHPKVKVHMWTP